MSQSVLLKRTGITFDAEEGRWVTTKTGKKVNLNEKGEPDKGNPNVVKKMEGEGEGSSSEPFASELSSAEKLSQKILASVKSGDLKSANKLLDKLGGILDDADSRSDKRGFIRDKNHIKISELFSKARRAVGKLEESSRKSERSEKAKIGRKVIGYIHSAARRG